MTKAPTAHADCSPSSSHIWLQCPASVTQARGRVRIATPYTREGSAAHVVAENLAMGLLPPRQVTVDNETVVVDDDMIDAVTVYADHVAGIIKTADYYLIETQVIVSGLPEPLSGTADFLAWTGDTLDVVDLKYGKGVPIAVKDNPQLKIYGLGGLAAKGLVSKVVTQPVKQVRLSVVQPRISGPAVTTETLTVAELNAFKQATLKPALKRIAENDSTEIPGEHCRWCVRAGECRTLAQLAQTEARVIFAAPGTSALSDVELAAILEQAELIAAWIERVRAEASQRIDHGQTIPGWKLVAKQARRKWANVDDATRTLADRFPESFDEMVKLDTPAAVERVLKRARQKLDILEPGQGLVLKESSGTTLARVDDERPGVVTDAKSVFAQLTESLENQGKPP